MKSVLKKGTVISLKHKAVNEPILNVVQKVENNSIFLKVTEDFLKNKIFLGDKVDIIVLEEGHQWNILGFIAEIDIVYPKMIHIIIEDMKKCKDNRKEKRFHVNMQTKLYARTEKGEKISYAIVKNASSLGFGIISNDDMEIGTLVTMKAALPGFRNSILELKAKIVRVVKDLHFNEMGLEILEMDEINKDSLEQLIFSLENNERLFIAECLQ